MSCYHPLVGIFDGEYNENGKKVFKIEGSLDPILTKSLHPGSVVIPCGRCLGCRLDYSRSWADRMMLELDSAGSAVFVTLTYRNEDLTFCKFDDDGLPLAATLVKSDCQLFLKRLRKAFSERKLRFYLAGEYGERTFRPHYHAIIFGLSLADFPDLCELGINELGQKYYFSDRFARIWSHGHCVLADVSWKTCAYVARYVVKKVNGSHLLSESLDQLPEFALMSRKPGLGRFYLDSHPDCLDYSSINLSTPDGGLKIRIPKYFLSQLSLTDPERYDTIVKQRSEAASDAMLLKLSMTDLSYLEYLENEEDKKFAQISALRRA